MVVVVTPPRQTARAAIIAQLSTAVFPFAVDGGRWKADALVCSRWLGSPSINRFPIDQPASSRVWFPLLVILLVAGASANGVGWSALRVGRADNRAPSPQRAAAVGFGVSPYRACHRDEVVVAPWNTRGEE